MKAVNVMGRSQIAKKDKFSLRGKTRKKNILRKELIRRYDGHCHWCGIKTTYSPGLGNRKDIPDDLATIDHFYSRLDPMRQEMPHLFVLACYKCNTMRGREDEKKFCEQQKAQLAS